VYFSLKYACLKKVFVFENVSESLKKVKCEVFALLGCYTVMIGS
jgi:hypothetical protein